MAIVKMKRLHMLALESDRDRLFDALQRLGCLEVAEQSDKLSDPEWAALVHRDESALAQILTEPKNALCKQYVKLLDMDGVELQFEPAAVNAIAKMAIERKCGARGLRAIIESIMLDTMFELPGLKDVSGCVITEDVVNGKAKPQLITGKRRKARAKRNEGEQGMEPQAEPSVS